MKIVRRLMLEYLEEADGPANGPLTVRVNGHDLALHGTRDATGRRVLGHFFVMSPIRTLAFPAGPKSRRLCDLRLTLEFLAGEPHRINVAELLLPALTEVPIFESPPESFSV
jgi:hypothetical protein